MATYAPEETTFPWDGRKSRRTATTWKVESGDDAAAVGAQPQRLEPGNSIV